MAERKKLGDLLKEAGLIDDFQLESALSHQRNWGGKLGSILVELNFVQETDLARVIADSLRIPYVNLFDPVIPEAILKVIKPEVAKKYGVMPVKKEGNHLVVAMSDPLDYGMADALRFITGLTINPALAMESEIKDAIRKYYDHEEIVREQKPVAKKIPASAGKMELIHGSDLGADKEHKAKASILDQDEAAKQELADYKVRIDALISLLIEKGLITRDELVSMVYQKKMGL